MSLLVRALGEAVSTFMGERRGARAAEMAALAAHTPLLAPLARRSAASRTLLRPYYESYIESVSHPVWAISLETASICHALCTILRPSAVLDLGSGFSSVIFRLYARAAGGACRVHSVDTDVAWLERTGQFLQSLQLSTDGLMLWPEFTGITGAYDVILHDLGGGLRESCLGSVLNRLSERGMIILDDMNRQPYAQAAQNACTAARLRLFSLRSATLDEFGRHACVATGN